MKKKLLILFTLVMVLTMALTITSICFAEGEVEATEPTSEVVEQTADNNASVWFSELWSKCKEWVIGACSGISLSVIVSAIFTAIIKKATSKGFDSIEKATNSETIAEKTTEKMLDKWSNVALEVDIKPLMESQYKQMNEQINAEFKLDLQKQDKKTLALLESIEKLGAYFDCSLAVSDEAKQDFKNTIAEAKELFKGDTKVSAKVEVVAEAPKETKKETKQIAENY